LSSDSELTGKYLVLGANGGLGAAVVAALRERGCAVVEVDRPEIDLLQAGLALQLETVWSAHGPFDGLVHAAGLYPAVPALDTSEELFDKLMTVNARSGLIAAATFARLAIDNGRPLSIVMVSSGAASHAQNGTTAYAASKAALEAIVRGVALETGRHGIRVNAVAPGFIDVGSKLNPVSAEYVAALAAEAPQRRVATPDDIVPAILWLLGGASHWINGRSIAVDGGASLGTMNGPTWLAERS
jgi:3-oxoacyl-[acyl-carrier protein] reductase